MRDTTTVSALPLETREKSQRSGSRSGERPSAPIAQSSLLLRQRPPCGHLQLGLGGGGGRPRRDERTGLARSAPECGGHQTAGLHTLGQAWPGQGQVAVAPGSPRQAPSLGQLSALRAREPQREPRHGPLRHPFGPRAQRHRRRTGRPRAQVSENVTSRNLLRRTGTCAIHLHGAVLCNYRGRHAPRETTLTRFLHSWVPEV